MSASIYDTGKMRVFTEVTEVAGDLAQSARACRDAAEQVTKALRPRVVFLEDDPDVRKAYKRLLRPHCELTLFAHAKEAKSFLEAHDVDLLLSDRIGLPLLDYLQSRHPTLPVVVLSGESTPRRLPDGVDAWFHKPTLDGEKLREIVSTYAKGIL